MMRIGAVLKKDVNMQSRTKIFPAFIALINFVIMCIAVSGIFTQLALMNEKFISSYEKCMEIYTICILFEAAVIIFVIPVFAAGNISGEKHDGIIDMVLISKVGEWDYLLAKFVYFVQTAAVAGISALPVIMITQLFGGMDILNVILSIALIIPAVAYMVSLGIFSGVSLKNSSVCVAVMSLTVVILCVLTMLPGTLFGIAGKTAGSISGGILRFNPLFPLMLLTFKNIDISGGPIAVLAENILKMRNDAFAGNLAAGIMIQFLLSACFITAAYMKIRKKHEKDS